MKSIFRLSAWLPALLALDVVHAQTHADDPSDPSIHAPLPAYRSVFDGYRSASEPVQPNTAEMAVTRHEHATHAGVHQQQVRKMPGEHTGHPMPMHSSHHHMEEVVK